MPLNFAIGNVARNPHLMGRSRWQRATSVFPEMLAARSNGGGSMKQNSLSGQAKDYSRKKREPAAKTVRRNNTSGVTGVEWMEKKQRWRATICFQGKRRYLGSFERLEDAAKARRRAEEALTALPLSSHTGEPVQGTPPKIEDVCPPVGRDYSAQRLDLTGRRFGQLTVLKPAENIGSMTAWLCRCDCGKELAVMTAHLRSGQMSCGCKPKVTLVDGTCVELLRSKTIRRNNTSGVTGVEWIPRTNKWKAVIFFKGRRHYLGCYEKFEDAVQARKRGEEEYFGTFLQEFDQSDQANRPDS